MCRDHRCLAACPKTTQTDDPAGHVDIPAIVDLVRSHRFLMICQKQHRQNDLTGKVDSYQGGGPCHRGFWTHVETTNLSPPVKNNTDRMNQLVR